MKKTINNWIQLNRALLLCKVLGVGSMVLGFALAILLFFKMNEDPIVIIYEGVNKEYLTGERSGDKITQSDLKKFIIDFVKYRYTWERFDPEAILNDISCKLTGRFLKNLEKKLAIDERKKGKDELEQYAAFIQANINDEQFSALFDRVVRVKGIPLVTASWVSLDIVQDRKTPCNPMGLYVDGVREKDLP